MQVQVQPALLRWARERAALSTNALAQKLRVEPQSVLAWEETGALTLGRLEALAQKTHTPLGFLFLADPPEEQLPVADFRTVDGGPPRQPSPDLLETLYQCMRRQDWLREYMISQGEEPLRFVGSASMSESPQAVASSVRETIGLSSEMRASLSSWEEALRSMVEGIEACGILVMRNGVVGNNTRRKLDVGEFRGFALSDKYAPLVFVNGADARAAQMFTLAHELAHVWLGQSGVSDVDPASQNRFERFCNLAAAELLVPMSEFQAEWITSESALDEAHRLSGRFKVSAIVLLIRALEAHVISSEVFQRAYATERERAHAHGTSGGGGDFYNTQGTRLGKRFARAVIASAIEGRTLYTEAFRLLGIRSDETFDKLARHFQVIA